MDPVNLSTWTYSNGKQGTVTGTVDRDSPESIAAAGYLLRALWPQMFTGLCDAAGGRGHHQDKHAVE